MAAIRGVVRLAYSPKRRVIGISKLARLVEACGWCLQIQQCREASLTFFNPSACATSYIA
ncbi:hypothetical protein B1806_03460 [Metallibacterium scheffleri]|uniref:GTP cyclohydrolase I domain-containing protein n=1 Tax=Metallibacterium scheffleri TaxID=993689 RepID=A0A4S3KR91_9GAMM|nr:hypothetical protein B1806_03460 [Metallibacterium scheffleri]